MSFFGWFADLVERVFERFDRVDLRPFRRVAAPIFFALCAAVAGMYALGWWDFTFIERPERMQIAVIDNSDVPGGDVAAPDANEPPAQPSEDAVPADPAEPEDDTPSSPEGQLTGVIAQMSDLCAEGWYVTSRDFDPSIHRIAVQNVNLGASAAYSVRERNVYMPVRHQDYEYGEVTISGYELAAEGRPSLEAYGGYLFADNGTDVIIFDSYGRYVANFNEALFFAYTRDKSGAPLFYVPATERFYNKEGTLYTEKETKKYYALTRGGVVDSDYVDEVYRRGVNADLPPSYGRQTEPYPRSVVVNRVSNLSLKGAMTGWTRTLWGFTAPDGEEPFTIGWYDPEKLAEEAKKAEEERKAAEEAKKAEEEAKKAAGGSTEIDSGDKDASETEAEEKEPKLSAKERFEAAKAAEKEWEITASTAFNFSDGYACVANEKGQMWFIDHEGKMLFETRDVKGYNAVGRTVVDNMLFPLTNGIESLGFYYFEHGLVRVRRQSYDEDQFRAYKMKRTEYDDDELIYATGEKFTLAEGYDIISYSNGMILLEKDGKYGFMDYTGAWVVQPGLDGAKPFVEGLAPICRGGLWGVIDTAGNVVIPLAYDNVQTTSTGVVVCHREDGWTVFAKMAFGASQE